MCIYLMRHKQFEQACEQKKCSNNLESIYENVLGNTPKMVIFSFVSEDVERHEETVQLYSRLDEVKRDIIFQ